MLSAMDESVDPCDDFFHYACGTWNRVHVIPDDKSEYTAFSKLDDDVNTKVKGKVELLDPKSDNVWTSIHCHQTPPRYRHVIHRSRCAVQPPPFVVPSITAKRDVIHKTGST